MTTERDLSRLTSGTSPLRIEGRKVFLLDQSRLPEQTVFFETKDLDSMCFAIKEMVVRGAPSIGVAAAFGMAIAAAEAASAVDSRQEFIMLINEAKKKLDQTRPTAINLKWATDKMIERAESLLTSRKPPLSLKTIADELFNGAVAMMEDHLVRNRTLSEHGAQLFVKDARVLTHCNAGSLATCGWGTALGVIRSAHQMMLNPSVFVDETRPRNQGSKLTMWELTEDGIPSTLICDSMSGQLMAQGKIDLVIVGADRIAANGDTANKIGTYSVAVLAKHHDIPFYVAAPLSTIDPSTTSGIDIPIEYRDDSEVKTIEGHYTTVKKARALNPAFDVTPASLVTAIITEAGVLKPPFEKSIKEALKKGIKK